MMSILDIIKDIRGESSSNAKIEIIKRHASNPLFRKVVELALDPMMNFYIRKIPHYELEFNDTRLTDAVEQLSVLSSRELTGNRARDYLAQLLSVVDPDDAVVIKLIIGKSLDCGASAKLFNKAFGKKFIFVYPVALCNKFDEKTKKHIVYPAISQLKEDGLRCNAVVKNGNVTWYTRNGRSFELGESINNEVLSVISEGVLDGELLAVNGNGSILSRKKGNGIINSITKHGDALTRLESKGSPQAKIDELVAAYRDNLSNVRFTVWDSISPEVFRGEEEAPLYTEVLEKLFKDVFEANPTQLAVVQTITVENEHEAIQDYQMKIRRGQEGTILKSGDHRWNPKRVNTMLKIKNESEMDLIVVDMLEGTGKASGKLGSLLCRSEDGEIEVSVGSGFTDLEREELWDRDLRGSFVEVKYNEIITSEQKTTKSLFLPIFKFLREDKTETS
jgi:hypothetical protein